MKKYICAVGFVVTALSANAQTSITEQFRTDVKAQDSVIAMIVSEHALMSKVVERVSQNPKLHAMLIQHLTRLLKESAAGQHDHNAMMSPYAGEETREIKALSKEEEKSLLAGEGLGFAMAAELNHYPGPKHVLDMESQLRLSEEQKVKVKHAEDTMHRRAVELGQQLVQRERTLDRTFASGTMNTETLQKLTMEIGELRARLRSTHLSAHLEVRRILNAEQIASYDRLRGYASAE